MFIGRKNELKLLNDLFRTYDFDLVFLSGRAGTGKTTLVSEFIKDKPVVYFNALETNEKQNLEILSRMIWESTVEGGVSKGVFSSFKEAFEYLFKRSLNKQFVFVIDDFQNLTEVDKSVESDLKNLIDQYLEKSKLTLILINASTPYEELLYGRNTHQLKLSPLKFYEVSQFFSEKSWEEKAIIYAVFGGFPFYLQNLNKTESVEEMIKHTFLNPSSFFFREPENYLKQETRETAKYNALLRTIASGKTRLSEIADNISMPTSACSRYLKRLTELNIIKREIPYGEKSSRKTLYSFENNLFRFWYSFIFNNTSLILRGEGEKVCQKIESELSGYMKPVFEEICKEYLSLLLEEDKSHPLGSWWGYDLVKKVQTKIDIVGEVGKDNFFFADCNWTQDKVDTDDLRELIQKSHLFSYSNAHYVLFSKSGFTKGCVEKSKQIPNVFLVTFEEMCKVFSSV